jgi:hypothetical protein
MAVINFVTFLFNILFFVSLTVNTNAMLLSEWAFVTSHDAGTGYLMGSDIFSRLAKTQTSNLSGQLDCGVRAFDLRPALDANGSVVMNHGVVLIPTLLSTAIQDVILWASRNPYDLVLIYVSHCIAFPSGSTMSCLEAVYSDVFTAAGLTLQSNCTMVSGLSIKAAMDISNAAQGGHILAVAGCVQENYAEEITCYSAGGQACYGGLGGASMVQLEAHLNATTAAAAARGGGGGLWMAQAHWQYDAASLAAAARAASSPLLDAERSGVNPRVAALARVFPALNLLEVDHACFAGQALSDAVRARNGLPSLAITAPAPAPAPVQSATAAPSVTPVPSTAARRRLSAAATVAAAAAAALLVPPLSQHFFRLRLVA